MGQAEGTVEGVGAAAVAVYKLLGDTGGLGDEEVVGFAKDGETLRVAAPSGEPEAPDELTKGEELVLS